MEFGNIQVRKVGFSQLPVVSREEVQFFNLWAQIAPRRLASTDLHLQAAKVLEPFLHTQVYCGKSGSIRFIPASDLLKYCIPPTLLLQVAALPFDQRIIVEFSSNLAKVILDRSLGGSGESIEEGLPLSDIEKGIFTFLFLKAMDHVQKDLASYFELELRLEELYDSPQKLDLDRFFGETFFLQTYQLKFLEYSGYCRLFIPITLLQSITNNMEDLRHTAEEYQFFRNRLERIADTPLSGFLKVGEIELSEADLFELQPDDIVLIKECSVKRNEENRLWEGEGLLLFSQEANFGLRCQLKNDINHPLILAEIQEIVTLEHPPVKGEVDRSEFIMSDELNGQNEFQGEEHNPEIVEDGDNLEEMGPVLGDVPVPLVVELGRINCRARDIMYLRVGQILELNRSPHEPLDLVVNGQMIGRGELVEVEGKLGIRIISLNK